ncbi:MAG: GtrA family protein [Oscillospiraceae bacterium]|nr:GtrA family protein [Oscillospiraceae bacterium]MDD4368940.1 GtrA family protein [Oscillospiraceae bacterium]
MPQKAKPSAGAGLPDNRLRRQLSSPAFKLQLKSWLVGAAAFFLIFAGLPVLARLRAIPALDLQRPGVLYGLTAVASLLFVLPLLYTAFRLRYHEAWLGGEALGKKARLWVLTVRTLAALGAPLVMSYYFYARGGMNIILLAALTALGLLAGEILISLLQLPILNYLLLGLATTLISILSFNLANLLLYGSIESGGGAYGWILPKTISWILAVIFAFLTNRAFVFTKHGNIIPEFFRFVLSRLSTGLVIEYLGIFLLENILGVSRDVANLLASILVTFANYFLSKIFVFHAKES